MKRIVFILPIFFYLNSSAQDPYSDYKRFHDMLKADSSKNWKGFDMRIDTSQLQKRISDIIIPSQPTAKLIFVQSNGTKVYALPQDNMICLVPNIKSYEMPNPARGQKVDGMPPGTFPKQKLVPDNKKD
jgi:hypothetical protein